MANPHLLTGLGSALAVSLSCLGAAIPSSVAATYAMQTKGYLSHVPIIVSGVLGIYGIIIAILLVAKLQGEMEAIRGYMNLSAGLAVGLSCLASGVGMANFLTDSLYGYPNLAHRRVTSGQTEPLLGTTEATSAVKGPQPVNLKFFFMLTFLEALGLYGLIVALFLIGK